jgi:chromosome segregation ATPase
MKSTSIQTQLAELTAEYDRLRETLAADRQKLEEDTRRAADLRDRINELTRLTDESYPESTDD